MQIPSEKKQIIQPNDGNSTGNVFATFGVDLESNKGKIRVSEQVKKALTDADNADFAGYAGVIFSSTAGFDKIFAVSDKAFSTGINTPTTGWSEETVGSEPNSGNTVMNGCFFDGLALVSEATDVKSWNGSTWASWWQTTLGQSALTSERHFIREAANGVLYLTNASKVFRVTRTGTVSTSGNGTLDLSDTPYKFTAMEPSSNRVWFGTTHTGGGEAVIVEWDMSPNSATANKLHKVGANAVRCVAIWNDTPIAILSNGKVKYFNGSGFIDMPGVQLPVPDDVILHEDFVHPNGWAIIDELPHFFISGRIENGGTDLSETSGAIWYFPTGVWCIDPNVGFYHRYAIGSGATTQIDYGNYAVNVGALYATPNSSSTKFLCSYEYYTSDLSTKRSVLAYHDRANAQAGTAFLCTSFIDQYKTWKDVQLFHKKLQSGDKVNVYYRFEDDDEVTLTGAWASTTQFNAAQTSTGIEVGDLAFIVAGPGAGERIRITAVDETSGTTSITLQTAALVSATNQSVVKVVKFRFLGTIDGTTRDYHSFSIPSAEQRRKCQVLYDFKQAANHKMELDYSIIN